MGFVLDADCSPVRVAVEDHMYATFEEAWADEEPLPPAVVVDVLDGDRWRRLDTVPLGETDVQRPAVARTPDGVVILTSTHVVRIEGPRRSVTRLARPMHFVHRIEVDPDGRIHVWGLGRLGVIEPDGRFVAQHAPPPELPASVTREMPFGPDDAYFVASPGVDLPKQLHVRESSGWRALGPPLEIEGRPIRPSAIDTLDGVVVATVARVPGSDGDAYEAWVSTLDAAGWTHERLPGDPGVYKSDIALWRDGEQLVVSYTAQAEDVDAYSASEVFFRVARAGWSEARARGRVDHPRRQVWHVRDDTGWSEPRVDRVEPEDFRTAFHHPVAGCPARSP